MMDTLKNSKIVRFGVIGGINTLLDFGLLFVFNKLLGIDVIVANIMSTTIAFLFSFTMNKKYTFKTSGTDVKREFILFVVVTLFGLWVLQSLVIWGVTPLLTGFGLHDNAVLLVAKLFATGVSLVWNYILYDRVVFKNKTTD